MVALESTLIAHGLPWPTNLETAQAAEAAVRTEALPATVAVWQGRPIIGLDAAQLERLAQQTDVRKASSRDLAAAIVQGAFAATTVAATMLLAHARRPARLRHRRYRRRSSRQRRRVRHLRRFA